MEVFKWLILNKYVTDIFHWHNPFGCTMTLGLTQPLTEMSTCNISWEKRRPVRRADNLTTFMCRLSWNLGAWSFWNPQGLSRPVMRLLMCTVEWLIHTYRYLFLIGLNHHTQTTLTVQILNHVTAVRTVAFRFPISMKRNLQTSTSTAGRGTVQRPANFSERLMI